MGGIIFIELIAIVIVILITPAFRARARRDRDATGSTAHEAVISRLEDHRRRKNQAADSDRSDRSDG